MNYKKIYYEMAVSYENHNKAHDEKLDRYYLKDIHFEFMNNNPY